MKADRIDAYTTTPDAVFKEIWKRVLDGGIPTWEWTQHGGFTHLGDGNQWKNKAGLFPEVLAKKALIFQLRFASGLDPKFKESVRGVYLGRFSGMLITHFGDQFSEIRIVEAA